MSTQTASLKQHIEKVKVQEKYLNVKIVAQSHHSKTVVLNYKVMLKTHDNDFKLESAVYLSRKNHVQT